MLYEEGPAQGVRNLLSTTVGTFHGCEGSDVVSAEGYNVMHHVEVGVSKVRQQVLFLCDTNGDSVRKKVRDWLR